MNNRKYNLLLHPFFLVSILLLLVNDIYLKYAFHNWVTGKLSDFTGLFAFTTFFLVFFQGYKKQVIIFCGLFFAWWKSPLSDPIIDIFQINRIVDYSDLIALTVLPGAYFIITGKYDPTIPYKRFYLNVVCIVSLFAFCNTSPPRRAMYYAGQGTIEYNGIFSSSKSKEEILQKLSGLGFHYYMDSIVYYPINTTYKPLYRYRDSSAVWRFVVNDRDSSLYRRQQEHPFYIIPVYSFDDNTIRDLTFHFEAGYRKRDITTIHIRCTQQLDYADYENKLKRKYTKHFISFFK